MTSFKIEEKNMPGNHKWVDLQIGVLTTTCITHALQPQEAIKIAKAMLAKAEALLEHNQMIDDYKWENHCNLQEMEQPDE